MGDDTEDVGEEDGDNSYVMMMIMISYVMMMIMISYVMMMIVMMLMMMMMKIMMMMPCPWYGGL